MMLIQYIIDEPPKNTSNGRGNWILHLKEKQSLKQGGAIESAFDWDTKSQLRIHFHGAGRHSPQGDRALEPYPGVEWRAQGDRPGDESGRPGGATPDASPAAPQGRGVRRRQGQTRPPPS